jgi:hypothetical protein
VIVLEVSDYQDLLALNRALMEVRYLARDVDDATRGSSYLSRLHERVIEEIKESLHASGAPGQVVTWEKWQLLETREFEIGKVLEYLGPIWTRLSSADAKREVLTNQLRPFRFTENDVETLISRLDQMATGIAE